MSFDSNESIHEAKNNADGAANENTNAVKIVVEKDSNLEESRSTKSRNSASFPSIFILCSLIDDC